MDWTMDGAKPRYTALRGLSGHVDEFLLEPPAVQSSLSVEELEDAVSHPAERSSSSSRLHTHLFAKYTIVQLIA
jgi:hypothetical protein